MTRRPPGRFVLSIVLALGCGADSDEAPGKPASAKSSGPPTFATDVAPLVFEHCTPCHRSDGPAPFSFSSREDIERHAAQIVDVTKSGFMPPWLPASGYGNFEGARGLTSAQRKILADWVEADKPTGDLSQVPEAPTFADGWVLGTPDLELRASIAFEVPADGKDVYRNFVIPVPQGPPRFVQAVELRPGNPRIAHHAVMRVDVDGDAKRQDALDAEAGFDGMVLAGAKMPGGRFIGWTPGKAPDPGSAERSWLLVGGSDLVVQVHLRPSGKLESVQPQVGLHFAATPPTKRALAMELSSTAIDIEPGDEDYRVSDTFELPADVSVISVYPHAHYIGSRLEGYATLPDRSTRWLIKIDDWDFNWQDQYRFERPVHLPKGSVITMDYHYDNSAKNPHNPSSPPRRVVFGPDSTDEMAELILEIEPADPRNFAALDKAFLAEWLSAQIDTAERSLKIDPGDAKALATLAALLARGEQFDEAAERYTAALAESDDASTRVDFAIVLSKLQRPDDARVQLAAALKLEPEMARAYLVLGNLERVGGKLEAAVAAYRRCLKLDPAAVEAHNNLGIAREKQARPQLAATAFRDAVELSPGRALFRENLGRALEAAGEYDDALTAYRAALQRSPGSVKAMRGLAWLLAAHPDTDKRDPTEALAMAKRVGQATAFRSPEVMEALAAATARSGQFQPAIAAIDRAIELATAAKRADLVARYQARKATLIDKKPLTAP